jgi:hypothetical protein
MTIKPHQSLGLFAAFVLFSFPVYALEPSKNVWLDAVKGGGGVTRADAYLQECGGRDAAFRGEVEKLIKQSLSVPEQQEVLKAYDEDYERQRKYIESRNKVLCDEGTVKNKLSGGGGLIAGILGHSKFEPALEKRRKEIAKKVKNGMNREPYKSRSRKFDIKHGKDGGYQDIAKIDALFTACGDRDAGYRESVSDMWTPRKSREHVSQEDLQKLLIKYDEEYETSLKLYKSETALFCAEETMKDLRRNVGWRMQGSGHQKYDDIIKEAKAVTNDFDDESWLGLATCLGKDTRAAMLDCWCVAKRLTELRASGDLRHEAKIENEIKTQCAAPRWSTYTYQFSRCEARNALGRNFDCQCQAVEFSNIYEKTPVFETNYISQVASGAMAACKK